MSSFVQAIASDAAIRAQANPMAEKGYNFVAAVRMPRYPTKSGNPAAMSCMFGGFATRHIVRQATCRRR